jgi:hypothetical protein
MVPHITYCDCLRDCLLQQQQGLGSPSGERIGRPQGRSDYEDPEPEVRLLREGSLKRGDGLEEVTLAQGLKTYAPIYVGTGIRVIGGLGNPHSFLGGHAPLGEGATLGKARDEETAGLHGNQPRQAETLMKELAVETRYTLLQQLYRLTIRP